MDRGRKAMPVQNKACMERHIRRCQELHRQKLRDMKCSVDNKAPRQGSHLRTKAKKNALLEDRISQIETENRILLEKMSHIMRSKGGIDNKNTSIKYGQSLNIDRRKRELSRITKDNYQILRRIQDARPTYDHMAWDRAAKANDQILQNICEFKPDKKGYAAKSSASSIPLFKREAHLLNYDLNMDEEDEHYLWNEYL